MYTSYSWQSVCFMRFFNKVKKFFVIILINVFLNRYGTIFVPYYFVYQEKEKQKKAFPAHYLIIRTGDTGSWYLNKTQNI